jgi:hypothetical protein
MVKLAGGSLSPTEHALSDAGQTVSENQMLARILAKSGSKSQTLRGVVLIPDVKLGKCAVLPACFPEVLRAMLVLVAGPVSAR